MPRFIHILILSLCVANAGAQPSLPTAGAENAVNLTHTEKQLDNMTARLDSGKATKEQMSAFLQELTQIQENLNK